MAGVYDNCAHCGVPMVHAAGRGKAKRYCGDSCAEAARALREANRVYSVCRIEGCCANATRVGDVLCEMHYTRLRRTGCTTKAERERHPPPPAPKETQSPPAPKVSVLERLLVHSGGYLLAYAPDHPLRRASVRVYQHRVAYYDAHGAGPFNCHWCSTAVTWDDMHVDHLDDDKQNNSIGNLAASCPACNQRRGQWKITRTHRDRTGVTVQGQTLTLNEWASRMGIARGTIINRMAKGWDAERAVMTPRGPTGPKSRGLNG